MTSNIPIEGVAHLNGHATDNANDAKKEARLTFQKLANFLVDNRMGRELKSYGVTRKPVLLGDPFHIDALAVKHASIGACGNTVKGKHDQKHHRQAIQNLYDILVRDKHVIKEVFHIILGEELTKELGLPHPIRERDARWLSNSRAAKEILKYMHVVDEEGTNFWTLFCREVQHLYTDFRLERLGDEAQMLLAPTIVAGLHFEAELGDFFEMTHDFHAKSGQLADRAGFRSMEIVALYVDKVLPYWQEAKNNPSSKFQNTYAYLDTIADPKLKQMKLDQMEAGIHAGHAEIALMTKQLLEGPWLLTLITHPVHGPDVARAVYKVACDYGVSYYGDDDALIDWTFFEDGEEPSTVYKAFLDNAENRGDEIVHYLQQFGLMTVETRDEAMRLTREKPGCRDPGSSQWLLDFAQEYPRLFDKLHAQFALFPSNTRIAEQMHGVERNAYNSQASTESATARNNYIMGPVYEDRRARREMSFYNTNNKSSTSTTKRRKVAPKHNDKKYLLVELGQQLKSRASGYTQEKLSRIPLQVRKDNSISRIKERGTDCTLKLLKEQKLAHAKQVARKRVKKGFTLQKLEDQKLQALNLRTDHDTSWNSRDQTEQYAKLKLLSFKTYWRGIKKAQFHNEIERVLPAFHALCPDMKDKTKKALLDTGTTKADNVFLFLRHVQQIAEKKIEDDISAPSRAEELKDSSTEDYLLEFIKVDESEHLETVATEQASKMQAMHTLMKEFANKETEQQYGRNFERLDYTVKTTSYCEGDFMYCSDDEEDDD